LIIIDISNILVMKRITDFFDKGPLAKNKRAAEVAEPQPLSQELKPDSGNESETMASKFPSEICFRISKKLSASGGQSPPDQGLCLCTPLGQGPQTLI
jgi:hypothetical protein